MCNGDNSSCTCVVYENFTVPEMDCRLVGFSLGNIVQQIDGLIATLNDILDTTSSVLARRRDPGTGELPKSREAITQEVDTVLRYVGEEVLDSNDFLRSCVNYYASALNSFMLNNVAPAAGVVA